MANHDLRSDVRFVIDVLSAACLIVLIALLVPRVLLPLIGDEATDVAIVALGWCDGVCVRHAGLVNPLTAVRHVWHDLGMTDNEHTAQADSYVVTFERGQTLSLDGLRRMSLADAQRLVDFAALIPKHGQIVCVENVLR